MSWSELHERHAVLEVVLARAQADPATALELDEMPDVVRLFGSVDNILLALQHRWTNHLAARLDQALEDGTTLDDAWLELAAQQPALRGILDQAAAASRPLRDEQRRMIDAHLTGRFAETPELAVIRS